MAHTGNKDAHGRFLVAYLQVRAGRIFIFVILQKEYTCLKLRELEELLRFQVMS